MCRSYSAGFALQLCGCLLADEFGGDMRVFVAAAVLTASLAMAGPVEVKAETGNEVFEKCTADEDRYFDGGFCAGYIIGVVDERIESAFCPPKDVTNGQFYDVAVMWLRDNPQVRHFKASSLIRTALAKAWPCPGDYDHSAKRMVPDDL